MKFMMRIEGKRVMMPMMRYYFRTTSRGIVSVRQELSRVFKEAMNEENADVAISNKADYQCNGAFQMAKRMRKNP